MTTLREDLENDITQSFLSVADFGETATLLRGGSEYPVPVLFDMPTLSADSLGIVTEAISHTCRLYVKASNLPDSRPRKGDRFSLSGNEFHSAVNLLAKDYVFERDGIVCYRLVEAS